MRRVLTAAACFALAAAMPALAQPKVKRPAAKTISAGGDEEQPAAEESDQGEEADQGAETEGTEVNQTERPSRVKLGPTAGGRETAPGEVHNVVRGDTLWDLSQQFLGNPWYWPKVWSYNPEIANPHWIYPGNQVRFFPGGEGGPTQVETGEGPSEPTEISDGSSDQITPDIAEASPVQLTGPIGYRGKGSASVVHTGFVTQKELEESGNIDSSFSEARMLSAPDVIYVKFKGSNRPRLQERYIIFHTESEVKHPSSLFRYGYLTKILGTARVIDVSAKNLVSMQIEETWDPITRQDLVGPFGEKLGEKIAARANDRELKGFVIGSLVPTASILGEHHVVVVDKGSADGVQPGNTFVVVRRQDPIDAQFMNPAASQNDKYPLEDIGQCMAIDVKEKATTCLMTRSIREIVFGDRVEMRTGKGSTVSYRGQ